MVPMYEPWMEGPENGFTLMGGMIRPQSRGSLRLSGPAPDDPLLIDPNILACESDLDSLVAGVELVRRDGRGRRAGGVGRAGALPRSGGRPPRRTAPLRARRRSPTTTRSGPARWDATSAVVDPRAARPRVEGLRVADASIMPAVTTGNTNAPSIMIGERAADFISGDRGSVPASAAAAD